MKIEHLAFEFQACTADKECGKCYQYEQVDGKHWCHQYDCETRRGMRCAMFGSGKPKAKQGETNAPELF
jgi:hypothetical protein